MLIPQTARSETRGGHGRTPNNLADVRRELASPSNVSSGVRQRLLGLAQRLARVQALGDGYARVGFSPEARAAMEQNTLAGP